MHKQPEGESEGGTDRGGEVVREKGNERVSKIVRATTDSPSLWKAGMVADKPEDGARSH